MKNKLVKIGKQITKKAVVNASIESANTTCFFLCNQPKLPNAVKQLRKK